MATAEGTTRPAVLIAAFSGRALAQSARRAGYAPLVVDCFGDDDMRAVAQAYRTLPARVQVGFTPRALVNALDDLSSEQTAPPLGLVLGSGFECNPRLVERLATRFPLIGNSADVIRRAKDPATFFPLLARLGIRHPEWQANPPAASAGWLMKRIGGSGGLHIHDCPPAPHPDPRRYFQRKEQGEAISVLGIVGPKGHAFALSQQWAAPLPRRPYRYGGAVSLGLIDPDLEARMVEASLAVSQELALRGLVSFDFLVSRGEPILIEVNPRPGASLDVFDDADGSLFHAHVLAARGEDAAEMLSQRWRPVPAKASAYLYADRGALEIGDLVWPDFAADRPARGSVIAKGQPLATVTAEAADTAAAHRLCRERLGLLETLLYEDHQREEAST